MAVPPHCTATTTVVGYMAASVGMVIANKRAVGLLRAGTVLLAAQLLVTIAFVLLGATLRLLRPRGTLSGAARWSPTGVLNGLLLWTGMQSVKRSSLSTLTVVRNASPLFVLVAEWFAFGAQPSTGKVLSLVVILVGVCIYTWADLQDASTDRLGVVFIALDAFLVSVDGLLERYLLAVNPIDLNLAACVLVQNCTALLVTLLLLAGPLSGEWAEAETSELGLAWGALSLPGGVAMSFLGVFIRRVVSATAALVVSNVDKVMVLLYGVVVMGDGMDRFRAIGCVLALAGGAWHALAPASGGRRAPAATPAAGAEQMMVPLETAA